MVEKRLYDIGWVKLDGLVYRKKEYIEKENGQIEISNGSPIEDYLNDVFDGDDLHTEIYGMKKGKEFVVFLLHESWGKQHFLEFCQEVGAIPYECLDAWDFCPMQ